MIYERSSCFKVHLPINSIQLASIRFWLAKSILLNIFMIGHAEDMIGCPTDMVGRVEDRGGLAMDMLGLPDYMVGQSRYMIGPPL